MDEKAHSLLSSQTVLLKLFLIIIGGNITYYYLQTAVWEAFKNSGDLWVYYSAGQLAWSGEFSRLYDYAYYNDIAHSIGPYRYLPPFAIMFSPLTLFSFQTVMILWMVFNQLLLGSSVLLVASELSDQRI